MIKTIVIDGVLKAGVFFFLLCMIFALLLDLHDYMNDSKSLEPLTDNFVWVNQIFQHIAYYLFMCLLGGVGVGIITYLKQKNDKNIY